MRTCVRDDALLSTSRARRLSERPLVKAAFARGETSYSKVRALLRLDDDFDEEPMLTYARGASAAQLERIVRGCRRCVAAEQDAARRHAEREFRWSYDEDGDAAVRGAAFASSIRPASQSRRRLASRAATAPRSSAQTARVLAPHGVTLYPRESCGENVDLSWTIEALMESRAGP